MFEPELFLSIKFYIKEPKATVCVFRKGTVIITGICTYEIVDRVIDIMEGMFKLL